MSVPNYHYLEDIIASPGYQPNEVEQISKAAKLLCQWTISMTEYHRNCIRIKSQPIILNLEREALVAENSKLALIEDDIEKIKREIRRRISMLSQAERDYQDLILINAKLNDRFNKLQSLAEILPMQIVKWNEIIDRNSLCQERVLGDAILAAAYIIYLGMKTQIQREESLDKWKAILDKYRVKRSQPFKLYNILCTDDQLQA